MSHIDDFLHVIPSKLLTPDETLNTSEMNQNKFTTFHRAGGLEIEIDICSVVAVTLEKNVAIVVMLTYRVVALYFSSATKVGKAMIVLSDFLQENNGNIRTYPFPQKCAVLLRPHSSLFG